MMGFKIDRFRGEGQNPFSPLFLRFANFQLQVACKYDEPATQEIRVMKRPKSTRRSRITQRSEAGFSLIELLIAVAVILIIAAIAIPNYIQSKMRANEASAAQSIRNIVTAEFVYSTTYGINFTAGPRLIQITGSGVNPNQNNAGLIDDVL